jgi:hypothetical protein
MKTKLALLLVFAVLTAAAQTNSVHNWTLKTGEVFPGDYFTSGSQMVVIKSHGTNCLLKISELSKNDWLYFQDCKTAQRQRLLDAEAAQMRAAGWLEFSAKLIENFPEKVQDQKKGWMDVTFNTYSSTHVASAEMELGIMVTDANGDNFDRCSIFRQLNRPDADVPAIPNPLIDLAMGLKRGDKIRLVGHCYPATKSGQFDENSTFNFASFNIDRIEMIESAADAAAVKQAKQDFEN